ncbi:hypothetical protein MRB53_016591 [Persea americana]|uniref:Uncharacterized protein n=1 Tax=Persea americana TaxID=3435 RepID=A0ACC2M2B5_PERAE|nr:hypothetical protein MRB53_016591 [Persea americana]
MSKSSALEPDTPSSGRKILETFMEEFEIGSRLIMLKIGKIASFANGAIVMGMEDTRVLSTVEGRWSSKRLASYSMPMNPNFSY